MTYPPGYQKGQTPEQYWQSVRQHPDFGKFYLNIKTQPLACELVPKLQAKIIELENKLKEKQS